MHTLDPRWPTPDGAPQQATAAAAPHHAWPLDRGARRMAWMLLLVLAVSCATRIGLALMSQQPAYGGAQYTLADWARLMAWGTVYDLYVALAFALPWALYDLLLPARLHARPWIARAERTWAWCWGLAYALLLLVVSASEFVFWSEFNGRFNFVAVDYLIYTQEVLRNIRESYPVGRWLTLLALAAAVLMLLSWPRRAASAAAAAGWRRRALAVLVLLALLVGGGFALEQDDKDAHPNLFVRELSGNGIYSFFHAFRHNQIDYARYYPTLPAARADALVRELLAQPGARFSAAQGIARRVEPPHASALLPAAAGKRPNVVLVSVESLSADFMGLFGNPQGLTPRLDALAAQSLHFTNLYATGTRTVRGLEALSIAAPPTPGQSIVRRPDNEGLATLGQVLRGHGYEALWIYGGYGMFDNMNAYFGANGYRVVDRTDAARLGVTVHHENVWGIADEDLYTLALTQLDQAHAAGRPFFAHVMTTSNHRPYTFPAGRVAQPQKTRAGAVAYTDWALGDFIERARARPWFDDTLFILTADHTAGGAGKTDLPPARYHIPMLWYAPKLVAPRVEPRLASQIDLAPTLLGALGLAYDSRFFGYDLFALEPGRERAFISTYQTLGLLRDGKLVVLPIKGAPRVEDGPTHVPVRAQGLNDARLVDEAIAWYQGASAAFTGGALKAAAAVRP